MDSLKLITIPIPEYIGREDDSVIFKVPLKPYVVMRDNKKFLYRWEQWGLIEYDYQLDQFSAFVDPRASQNLPHAPLGVYWLVTAPCNLRCIHCYGNVEELPRQSLTEAEQNKVADRIIDSGAMRVTLNGGEPLLRKDTPAIIEKLADHNIAVVLGTNGTYLQPNVMSAIKRTSLVEISLDASTEKVNNSIRVSRVVSGNAYREALAGIDICLSYNVKVRVLTCVNSRNVDDLEATADLLYSRGVRDWSVSWTLFAGRARFIYEDLVAKETASAMQALSRVKLKYPDMRVMFSNRSNSSENNLYSFLVFPNGRAFAEDLSQGKKIAYESLLEKPLTASWTTENYNIQKHLERWTSGRVQSFTEK